MIRKPQLPAGRTRATAVLSSQSRLTTAVALSLLFHAFLLSLQFGIAGLGLPGMQLPWEERLARAPQLNIRLAGSTPAPQVEINSGPPPAPAAAEPVQPPPLPPPAPAAVKIAPPVPVPQSLAPGMKLMRKMEAPAARPAREAPPAHKAARKQFREPLTAPRRVRRKPPKAKPKPPVIAAAQVQQDSFHVPPASEDTAPNIIEETRTPDLPLQVDEQILAEREREEESLRLARQHEEENVRRQALEQEAHRQAEQLARQQAARQLEEENLHRAQQLEAQRRDAENARQLAMEQEARRQAEQFARQQAARQLEEENLRRAQQLEAQRRDEENARQLAMEQEARRQAAADAARRQAEAAARQHADAQARSQQADRHAAASASGGGAPQGGAASASGNGQASADESPPREAVPSATNGAPPPGSAARRDNDASGNSDGEPIVLSDGQLASMEVEQVRKVDLTRLDARSASEMTEAAKDTRRRSVFGAAHDDIVLKMYIDSWRQAAEHRGNLDYRPASQASAAAVITVTIRSDGSIAGVAVDRSSGNPKLDETVRRVLQAEGVHPPFPPDLRRRYDVIEIRRVWRFGERLRILEETR